MPASARWWSGRGGAAARQRNSSLLERARQLQALVRRRLACRTKVHAQSKDLPTIVVEEWHGLALPRTVSQGEAELSSVMKSESAQCEELYADAERSKVVAGREFFALRRLALHYGAQ